MTQCPTVLRQSDVEREIRRDVAVRCGGCKTGEPRGGKQPPNSTRALPSAQRGCSQIELTERIGGEHRRLPFLFSRAGADTTTPQRVSFARGRYWLPLLTPSLRKAK